MRSLLTFFQCLVALTSFSNLLIESHVVLGGISFGVEL